MDVFLMVNMVAYAIAFCLEATMDFNLYSTRGKIRKRKDVGRAEKWFSLYQAT